jgi:hypothetical protein
MEICVRHNGDLRWVTWRPGIFVQPSTLCFYTASGSQFAEDFDCLKQFFPVTRLLPHNNGSKLAADIHLWTFTMLQIQLFVTSSPEPLRCPVLESPFPWTGPGLSWALWTGSVSSLGLGRGLVTFRVSGSLRWLLGGSQNVLFLPIVVPHFRELSPWKELQPSEVSLPHLATKGSAPPVSLWLSCKGPFPIPPRTPSAVAEPPLSSAPTMAA